MFPHERFFRPYFPLRVDNPHSTHRSRLSKLASPHLLVRLMTWVPPASARILTAATTLDFLVPCTIHFSNPSDLQPPTYPSEIKLFHARHCHRIPHLLWLPYRVSITKWEFDADCAQLSRAFRRHENLGCMRLSHFRSEQHVTEWGLIPSLPSSRFALLIIKLGSNYQATEAGYPWLELKNCPHFLQGERSRERWFPNIWSGVCPD